MIGPSALLPAGAMVINLAFRPHSEVRSPNTTIPRQPILYNIPKSE